MPWGAPEFGAAGEQWRSQRLGERNVCAIVGRDRVAQLPDARHQFLMRIALNHEPGAIIEDLLRSGGSDVLEQRQSPQGLGDFHVEQMGCVHALARHKYPGFDRIRPIRSQQEFEKCGSVNNDQR
jgi:hypothetical protein